MRGNTPCNLIAPVNHQNYSAARTQHHRFYLVLATTDYNSCASCHGADGSGGTSDQDVRGDSASSIASTIESESDMQSLNFLSSGQIQDIASFLNSNSDESD